MACVAETVPGVQAVGSIVTPPLPGESAWIQCAYHLETRAFGYVKDSKGNMFVFPSGLTASERSIRNTADGVPCPCREEHLVGVFLVETGSIVADQTFLPLERSIRDRGRARRSLMKHVFGVLAEDIPTCRTCCTETLFPFRADLEWDMNSLRQVQPHGSSSSSSRRPTPSRPSKPAKTLVVFACRPRFSTSYSHHCKGLPLCIGWPSPAYRMVFVTMASLTRQFGREYPEEGQGVQAVGSIVTPPPPRGVCLDTVRLSFGNTPASWEAWREVLL